MAWEPVAREVVVKVAIPEELRVAEPIAVAPSRNVTVPVGMKANGPGIVTVAVNVTGWAGAEGLRLDVREMTLRTADCNG